MNNGNICVSVCAETADEMIAKIKLAMEFADLIEVRFDCLHPDQVELTFELLENSEIAMPMIATFRQAKQGGISQASLDERKEFWKKNHKSFWAADVEEDVLPYADDWNKKIASFHDFDRVPENLGSKFDKLSSANANVVKIAVQTNDISDSIPVWNLLKQAKAVGKDIIPIAMGEAGKWTRILGLAHSAFMTYASLGEGMETADGQITAKDLIETYRVKELNLNTQVYGVIGDPVSESLSPYMHNPAFAEQGINAVFIPLQVSDLDEFMRRMVRHENREVELNFGGFSVTMPHKQAIIKHLDVIDPTVEKIGAVNTVNIEGDKLTGYNTDAHGFITPLKEKFGDLKGVRVAVFGSGGAARACVFALNKENADVTVFARNKTKMKQIADELGVRFEQLATGHRPLTTDILINATPIGMKGPLENESLFTAEQLEGVKFVYDLVTSAADTPLIREAKKANVPAIGGLEMLIHQGAKQFEMWTGGEAPIDMMRQSLINRQQITI